MSIILLIIGFVGLVILAFVAIFVLYGFCLLLDPGWWLERRQKPMNR